MVTKEVMPCSLEGLVSSAHGNKTCFDADVALHLGTRQASSTDGTAGCAAEINAFVKGRMSSQCTRLAKKGQCDAGVYMQENCVLPHRTVWVWSFFECVCVSFFSKGCQQIEVNVEKG